MKTITAKPAAPTTARPACPAHMRELTLGDAETYYKEGRFPMSDLIAYLRAWNATPGRFTQAFWRGNEAHGRLVQVDAEELTPAARELYSAEAAKCGANIGAPAPAKPPQVVELETVDPTGANTSDPRNLQFYANGKRISCDEFTAIRRAAVRLTEETSASVNGKRTFYRTAYLPA